MNKYFAFGLNILSELEFPEFIETDFQEADLEIRYDNVPVPDLPDFNQQSLYKWFENNEFFYNMPGVARYSATNGERVIIDPMPGSDLASIRLFVMSAAMAAVMSQRKQVVMHASSILHQESLILFAGEAGAGKSTLVAELGSRGYQVFSDDTCVLQPPVKPSEPLRAIASYPMIKLWESSIQSIGSDSLSRQYKIRPGAEKYGQFFHDRFIRDAYPVSTVVILEPDDTETDDYSMEPIGGLHAFELLCRNTYGSSFYMQKSLQSLHLEMISNLIRDSKIYIVRRSKSKSEINAFTDFLTGALQLGIIG